MDPVLARVLLVFGLPNAVWPYKLARFGERMDSIGSKRSWSEVEPTDWKVTLTRVMGVGMALFGAGWLLVGWRRAAAFRPRRRDRVESDER